MSSEALLRAQYQTIVKERDTLQNQFEQLERENQELRRSVYELSLQLSQLSPTSIFQIGSKGGKWKSIELDDNSGAVLPPPPNPVDVVAWEDTRQVSYKSDLKGHNGSVYCMDISHNGKWIASGSFDKSIVIWKGSFPHKQVSVLTGHTQLVSALAWGLEKAGEINTLDSAIVPPVLYSSSYDKTVSVV
jgi:WD40 repeat protein